jgi:hypothetical protein
MYSILLFVHIVGALGIFASLAVEHAGLFHLRRAVSSAQAREWLSLLRTLQRIQGPSALALLATGLYMMATRWSHQAWAGLGLVGMILMAVIGVTVTGRRMKAIGAAAFSGDGPLLPAIRDRLADPMLRLSLSVRLALALGIVFNMSVKPTAAWAVVALIVAAASGLLMARAGGGAPRRAHQYSGSR